MKISLFLAALTLFCGVARGQTLVTTASLSGLDEAEPNNSPGTGTAVVTYDPATHLLRVQVNFSGLEGEVTAAHIHAPVTDLPFGTASVATSVPTFPGFPSGVTEGVYDSSLDLTDPASYRPGFITDFGGGTVEGAEAALVAALQAGSAYLNIHTTIYGSGEIRGFLGASGDSDNDGVPDVVDAFPNSRDVGGSITVDGCDTGVINTVFEDGTTLSDILHEIAANARNKGVLSKLLNEWKRDSTITNPQANDIRRCAGILF